LVVVLRICSCCRSAVALGSLLTHMPVASRQLFSRFRAEGRGVVVNITLGVVSAREEFNPETPRGRMSDLVTYARGANDRVHLRAWPREQRLGRDLATDTRQIFPGDRALVIQQLVATKFVGVDIELAARWSACGHDQHSRAPGYLFCSLQCGVLARALSVGRLSTRRFPRPTDAGWGWRSWPLNDTRTAYHVAGASKRS
jgi:hypothetical protein